MPEHRTRDHRHGGLPSPDQALSALAARQHGVVARPQLATLAITPRMVERRLASGRLVRLHRGVYAVGHARLRREGFWLAAVLAAGPGAVLSHRDAAALHGLRPPHDGRIDVTTARRRDVPGVCVHGRAAIAPDDLVTVDGIIATSVARTLVDLAAVPGAALARAIEEAERRGVLDVAAIDAVLRRTRGRRGAGHAAVRAALADHAARGTQLLRSELEARFVALTRAHGLPRPRVNQTVDGFEVDAVWSAARVVVELDGWEHHRTRAAFQRDRAKANRLQALGWRVYRYTHDDVVRDGDRVAAELRARLV